MRNFNDYAEKAIERFGLSGYNNLAREIGITKCVMSQFRHGKSTPSEETFLKIVELAGMPKEEALIDLNLWRSKNDPTRHEIWKRIAKMIGCAFIFSLFFNTQDTHACSTLLTSSDSILYIMYNKIKKVIKNQIFIFYKDLEHIINSVKSITYGSFKNDRLTTA